MSERRLALGFAALSRRPELRVFFPLAAAVILAAATLPAADSPVADAAMRGDRAAVKTLLQQGEDVNAAQGDGMTALHWAAENADPEMAKMLLYAGARADAATRNGNYTPLHLAARRGSVPVITALLEAGAEVDAKTTSGGATALHFAAATGSADAVTTLLDRDATVDVREVFGQTPLMWAAAYDRPDVIRVLVARGADHAATSIVENVPERERVNRAAQQVRNRKVAALRAAEQPQNAQGGRGGGAEGGGRGGRGGNAEGQRAAEGGGRGAGQQAAAEGRAGARGAAAGEQSSARGERAGEPARAAGAQGNAPAPAGDTAYARSLSYGELVGNRGGLSPLLFAARQGNTAAALALLESGADMNQVSAGDHTSPMLMATMNGHFDLAKLLLERGADPNLASDAGAAPLYVTLNVQWSAKSLYPQPVAHQQQTTTYLELMEALLKAGADPNARLKKHLWYMSYNFDLLGVNTTGASPFWRAAYGTDVPAMRLLVQYGADHTVPTIKTGGRQRGDDAPAEDEGGEERRDPSGLPPIPPGGPGVYPIHAASGVGYGEGYAANAHRHAPGGWLPAVKYLIEELGHDVNARDHNGYNAVHHAAARGDNELIEYLVSKGADVTAVSRRGQTTADMANGPVQRVPPFLETVALLEKLGSKNNHRCRSC
jgi:ankyrin repeat protein